jgi:hypothetical protein
MNLVATMVWPANDRLDFDPNGSEGMLGAFTTLPIQMPRTVTAWTGPDGRPVAMWADDKRIRPADFGVVWGGVEQFNSDLRTHGTVPELPPADDVCDEGDDLDEA